MTLIMFLKEGLMENYITETEFQSVLEEIICKIDTGELESVSLMIKKMIEDTEKEKHFIDRTYIGEIKAKKKRSRIEEIKNMLDKMSDKQVENIHRYTMDELLKRKRH